MWRMRHPLPNSPSEHCPSACGPCCSYNQRNHVCLQHKVADGFMRLVSCALPLSAPLLVAGGSRLCLLIAAGACYIIQLRSLWLWACCHHVPALF